MFAAKNELLTTPSGGYRISRSLRFRSLASANLNRTPSLGNRTTWTWSAWIKRGTFSAAQQFIFDCSASQTYVQFGPSENIRVGFYSTNSSTGYVLTTNAVFRDPSAWYHCVISVDTTQSTSANRVRIYVNSVEQTTTGTQPAQNDVGQINTAAVHRLGSYDGTQLSFDGYLAEVNFIDGYPTVSGTTYNATTWAALNVATLFGAYDTNGVWQPKAYTGTYGTNGFYLPFSDNSSGTNVLTGNVGLGKDFSGNGNFWTTNNASLAGSTVQSFTSTGTTSWTAPAGVTSVRYLVVAGGGGGGKFGGGGGGGGFLEGTLSVTPSNSYTVIVGNGGAGSTSRSFNGTNGDNSVFDSITATGGGGGASYNTVTGSNGGSGGGGAGEPGGNGGTATQGFSGGNGSSTNGQGGGGGGAGSAGQTAPSTSAGGNGGAGLASSISGSSVTYAGGGGGAGNTTAGTGGAGGGGAGKTDNTNGTSGTANTGGGGGGSRDSAGAGGNGGQGGSGIVIITYGSGTTYDSMIDTPTNYADGGNGRGNYCTINPLVNAGSTISNANLTVTASTGYDVTGTLSPSGKCYFEIQLPSAAANSPRIGMGDVAKYNPWVNNFTSVDGAIGVIGSTGKVYVNGVNTATYSTFTTNNVVGFAFDPSNGKFWYSVDGVWANSGDPDAGTGNVGTGTVGLTYVPVFAVFSSTAINVNFGQRPFSYAPSSANKNSTFSAINTQNLTTPTIANGAQYMAAVAYAGNDVTPRSIAITSSNSGNNPLGTTFQPDFVWVKNRTTAGFWNVLFDSVRGVGNQLASNQTDAELASASNVAGKVSAFNVDGFSVLAGSSGIASVNATSNNYVSWNWNAGGAPTVNNTAGAGNVPTAGSVKINGSNSGSALAGSIAATRLSANTSAGFSVVTYTGTGANATVGHGLGVTPSMILIKDRDSSSNGGAVYHASIGATKYLKLFQTTTGSDAEATDNTVWNGGSPTFNSSVFSIGTNARTNSTDKYVAYCFAPVAGYSAFGSFVGNNSADGPFVYLGFRPRYILIKGSSVASSWAITDTSLNTYNMAGVETLLANSANAAGNYPEIDILSNGFKVRTPDATSFFNGSGQTYIYACFAENPFKIARAR